MSGSLKRAGAFFLLAAAAAILAPGCVVNESSMFIRSCQVVPVDTCEVTPDPTALFQSSGVLDTALAGAYFGSLLVGNQLVTRGDPNRLRTETSRIEITGADVSVTTTSGGSLSAFFTRTTGFVDPSSGAQPGYGIAIVELIPPALAATLNSQGGVVDVLATVVLHGRTLGGTELSTAEWTFPIRVCAGCLCDRSTCANADMPAVNCHVGTDAPVDCRLNKAVCQGQP